MAKSTLQERVISRIEALNASPITLAKKVGLERGYINDIIIGRKRSVRGAKLADIARALECDVDYLLGEQDTPTIAQENTIPIAGICETGVWRSAQAASRAMRFAPIEPDPRYPGMQNVAFEVRGDGFAAEGIVDGMFAVAVEREAWEEALGPIQPGSAVVVRHAMNGNAGAVETSLRLIEPAPEGDRLLARPSDPTADFPAHRVDDAGIEVLAIVTRAVRIFAKAT